MRGMSMCTFNCKCNSECVNKSARGTGPVRLAGSVATRAASIAAAGIGGSTSVRIGTIPGTAPSDGLAGLYLWLLKAIHVSRRTSVCISACSFFVLPSPLRRSLASPISRIRAFRTLTLILVPPKVLNLGSARRVFSYLAVAQQT